MYERIKATQQHLPKDIEHITRPQLLQFTRDTLSSLGIQLRRGMGQNFLVSPDVLRFILMKANLKSNDTILEIGGGIGTLSLFIAPQVKKLIIIEQDPRLIDVLGARLGEFNNVKIIPGDACKVNWPPFDKLVSNLPYQISSPITLRLTRTKFNEALITFQLEFAKRLIASVGEKEYSRISVQASLFLETEILTTLGRDVFFPSPKISSAIVKILPYSQTFKPNVDLFEQFLAILFSRKNKKVVNNLIPYFKRCDKQISNLVEKLLQLLKIQDKRSSQLSPQMILHLYNNLNISFQTHGFSLPKVLQQS